MSQQSDDHSRVVAVTGASGYIGARLLRELEEVGLDKLVAIDLRPLQNPVHNTVFLQRSVLQPLGEAFRDHKVDTVVHLAFVMRPGRKPNELEQMRAVNVGGLENVLRACRTARVKHLVYLSSHTVYGSYRDNPIPITEEAPLRPNRGFLYAEHKLLCEEAIRRFSKETPSTRVTVLRACVVMGPNARNYITQAFDKPVLVAACGSDPHMQFVHESDVARLITQLIREPHPGIYNVAGERTVRWSRMVEMSRRPMIRLPAQVLYPLTEVAWRLGLQKESPAVGLDFIRYPLIVSTGKLKGVTGFRFQYTSEEAVRSYMDNRD